MIHASIIYYMFCWTLSRGLAAATSSGVPPAGSMGAQGTHDAEEDTYTGTSEPPHLPWLLSHVRDPSPEVLSMPADEVLTAVATHD
jgi:hypothetical protein